MNVGDKVTLIPTEGGYQVRKTATIKGISPKRITVCIDKSLKIINFNRVTGKGASKLDRDFPNYKLEDAALAAD